MRSFCLAWMTISAAMLTSRSTYSTDGHSSSDSVDIRSLTMKIDTSSTSATIKDLERDPITVLSVPRQFDNGLDTFDDLPLDYGPECDSWVQVNCCRT
jgi:hypothetical protein